MASSTPTSKPEQQTPAKAGSLPGRKMPWWRRWVEPILAVTTIAALLTALVTGGSVAFQFLKRLKKKSAWPLETGNRARN